MSSPKECFKYAPDGGGSVLGGKSPWELDDSAFADYENAMNQFISDEEGFENLEMIDIAKAELDYFKMLRTPDDSPESSTEQ